MVNIPLQTQPRQTGRLIPEDFTNLPDASHPRPALRSHAWRPPTDVFETADEYILRVEIAGMQESDFSIVLDGRILSIRGIRSDYPERRAYHQMEIRYGEFISEIEVPGAIIVNEIEAFYSNGFLQVRLPKARPVKIQVED